MENLPTTDSLELVGNRREGRGEVGADRAQHGNRGNRDESGNKDVLDRRGAILVLEELDHRRKNTGSSFRALTCPTCPRFLADPLNRIRRRSHWRVSLISGALYHSAQPYPRLCPANTSLSRPPRRRRSRA